MVGLRYDKSIKKLSLLFCGPSSCVLLCGNLSSHARDLSLRRRIFEAIQGGLEEARAWMIACFVGGASLRYDRTPRSLICCFMGHCNCVETVGTAEPV